MSDKLINLQKDLKICTSNITQTVLNGWFDTNCESTLNFLNWFTNSINNDNIPTGLETEQFEYLQNEGVAFNKNQCDLNLAALERQYPSIGETKENIIQTKVLKSELVNLEISHQSLKSFHIRYKSLNEDLIFLGNEEASKYSEDRAREMCLDLAKRFDELNISFQKQLSFSLAIEPVISKHIILHKTDIDEHFSEIKVLAKEVIRSQNKTRTIIEDKSFYLDDTAVQEVKCSNIQNEISTMKKRIMQSLPQFHILKATRVLMEAKLKFLDEVDLYELTNLVSYNESLLQNKTDDERVKIIGELYKIAGNVTDNFTNLREIRNIENLLNINKNEYTYLQKFNAKVLRCLSHYTLISILCGLEFEELNLKGEFVQSFKEYIYGYLRFSQDRSAILKKLSSEWVECKEKPLEKNSFFGVLASILAGHSDTKDIFSQINNFNMTLKDLDNKYVCTSEDSVITINLIAFNSFKLSWNVVIGLQIIAVIRQTNLFYYDLHPTHVEVLVRQLLLLKSKSDIQQMKKFLQDGPTTKPVIVPFEINRLLYDFNEEIVWERKQIMELKSQFLDYSKTVSKNKWTKSRFQLWAYFLNDRSNIKALIHDLEQEVAKR